MAFFAYTEGYKAFQCKFSPLVVQRAMTLAAFEAGGRAALSVRAVASSLELGELEPYLGECVRRAFDKIAQWERAQPRIARAISAGD